MTTDIGTDNDLRGAHTQPQAIWQEMASGWEARRTYLREFSGHVTAWMIDRLDPKPGQTILDLAAGTGDTGFEAAVRIGPTGHLISTDFASNMVEVAIRRAKELAVTNVEFRVLNAESNDLETDSVDGVLCRWGYSLMLEPAAALAETRRVLREGGKHTLSVMGTPQDNPWGFRLMGSIVGLGLIPPPDPRHRGGLFSLADHDDLRRLISAAGFADLDIENQPFQLRFADFDDYWRFILEFAGGVSILLRSFSDEQRAAVRQATESAIQEFRLSDGYEFPAMTVNACAS
ncbi:MAG: class I SAM-dependent methyltransferase [Mycobacteriales bacterium]